MSSAFAWLMRKMPELLCAFAVAIYLCSVIVGIAAGNELETIGREMLPVSVKARSVVILFVQPLILPLVILFGAAVLWRTDRWADRTMAGAAK